MRQTLAFEKCTQRNFLKLLVRREGRSVAIRDRPPGGKEFVSSVPAVVPNGDRRVDKEPSRGHSGFSVCRGGHAGAVVRKKGAASRRADPAQQQQDQIGQVNPINSRRMRSGFCTGAQPASQMTLPISKTMFNAHALAIQADHSAVGSQDSESGGTTKNHGC